MIDLVRCKQLLPMPQLMDKLGLGDRAKTSARCPFHDDKTPSFGIDAKKGAWLWNCQAGCGGGDEVDLIAKLRNTSKGEAIREYAELAGVNSSEPRTIPLIEEAAKIFGGKVVEPPPPDKVTLLPLDDSAIDWIVAKRGYTRPFVRKLSDSRIIGIFVVTGEMAAKLDSVSPGRYPAFPLKRGGCHFRINTGKWRYSSGARTELFVLGGIEEGAHVHCFESQWDALAYAEASGEESNIVATRGAAKGNSKLIAQRFKGYTGTLYLWQQNDEPGQKWAHDIREALPDQQIKLALVPKEHKDFNDWLKAGAPDGAVFNAFLDAKDFNLDRGACLASTGGALALSNAAGSIPAAPTQFVTAPVLAEPQAGTPGEARESTTPLESRPSAKKDSRRGDTNLADTLDSIVTFLNTYIRFPEPWEAETCALWAAHTWVFHAFEYTPYLHVTGPETNCGKSTVLRCVGKLSRLPWNPIASDAALYLEISSTRPTLLLDELDAIYGEKAQGNEELRRILNAGFHVTGTVAKAPLGRVQHYPVFCPKLLCGIGALPNTLSNRAIVIPMARQTRDERATKARQRDIDTAAKPLTAFLEKWSTDAAKPLAMARPDLTDDLDSRYEDIAEPLIAIADMAGGKWPQAARDAIVLAFAQPVEDSNNIKLLRSFRTMFLTKDTDKIPSKAAVDFFVEMEEADTPWPSWWEREVKKGNWHDAARKIAKMLKGFGIHPRNIRTQDDEQVKGYVKADFETAWRRYAPSEIKLIDAELGL